MSSGHGFHGHEDRLQGRVVRPCPRDTVPLGPHQDGGAHRCGYSEDFDEGDDLGQFEDAEDDGCRWTSSDEEITLVRDDEESLIGTLSDDGAISLPDQPGWNVEIYTKQ